MATVKNGQHIVVKRARDIRLLFVKAGTTGAIGKVKFDFNDVIGRNFGVKYEVKQKRLQLCSTATLQLPEIDDNEDVDIETAIVDTVDQESEGQSKLDESSPSSIASSTYGQAEKKLKSDTSSGHHEIITKLALDNPSFRHKTVYAKEKYLTKKDKKYSAIITIYPPTIRLIQEIYYTKDSDKICYLRQDCLAHLLTWSNVHHGCTLAIVEQCLGIVTASVLERMSGGGRCIRLHKGNTLQSIPCLAAMDFDDQILDVLLPVPLDAFVTTNDQSPKKSKEKLDLDEKKSIDDDSDLRLARKEDRETRKTNGIRILKEGELDSFIMAGKEHPLVLMQRLVDCTKPSRPFVVYNCYVQPLLECYQWLRDENKAVNIQLMDTFYRKHQILPGRSHPEMNQPVAAGYILTGITVTS